MNGFNRRLLKIARFVSDSPCGRPKGTGMAKVD
jgi:hypothetical protein